jgi:hypothetical protein
LSISLVLALIADIDRLFQDLVWVQADAFVFAQQAFAQTSAIICGTRCGIAVGINFKFKISDFK